MPGWLEIVMRALSAMIMLIVITRILGKKQISQLTFLEFVIGITLGELVGFISTDVESNFWYGVISLLVWFIVPLGLEYLALKSKKIRGWLEGSGRVMIKEGKVLEDNLKKERVSADELLEQLRSKSVFNLADVEFAVMETNGDLSILLKRDKQPLTPRDMNMKLVNEVEPQTVIMDGEYLDEPLATIGLSRGWLNTELEKIGVTVDNVFLGQVDAYQQLYVDLYDDKLKVPAPQGKALVYATLKKSQADLELFAMSTRDPAAKQLFEQTSRELTGVIQSLQPMLQN
ncbi:DUF421 domain-containing protein [Cohnella lubricantis]|uniref:DUF421 domain-containing protein n=1 Tax=Cohnella lubricantis TaxID=2163172 RepID=A0A841TH81_9BACL|nr:DUF421 domain-containing protein [Cohnella lubricantis]MBB6678608.1 DUF421 domain-containing protein [Cohnella lubricantis]MBP2119233.1 uncharacterized membrane protein YcaP (DUF421 family) [Cohnella lubricantis]